MTSKVTKLEKKYWMKFDPWETSRLVEGVGFHLGSTGITHPNHPI